MAGLTEVSKKSGVHIDVIASVFSNILAMVAAGEDVKINGIGTFKRRLFAGRTLKTPLLAKPVKYGDSYVLKFHQSALAKQQLNALAKGEEPPEKKKVGPKPKAAKAAPEPEESEEEAEVPAKKPVKKVAAKKEEPPAKPVKKAAAKKEEPKPALKKKAAPPPEPEEEEDDEEDLEESEDESDDDDDDDDGDDEE